MKVIHLPTVNFEDFVSQSKNTILDSQNTNFYYVMKFRVLLLAG